MFTAMKNDILDSSSATLGNTLPTRGCRNKDNTRDIKELNIDIVSKMHIGWYSVNNPGQIQGMVDLLKVEDEFDW